MQYPEGPLGRPTTSTDGDGNAHQSDPPGRAREHSATPTVTCRLDRIRKGYLARERAQHGTQPAVLMELTTAVRTGTDVASELEIDGPVFERAAEQRRVAVAGFAPTELHAAPDRRTLAAGSGTIASSVGDGPGRADAASRFDVESNSVERSFWRARCNRTLAADSVMPS